MIDYIKSLLAANVDIDQSIAAYELGNEWIDTAAVITAQFTGLVSDRLYPFHLPDTKVYPNIVYTKAASAPVQFNKYNFYRSDIYILQVRAETPGALITLIDSITDTINAYQVADAAGVMEVNDAVWGYEDATRTYRAVIELMVTHLSITSQAIPLTAVSEQSAGAGPDETDIGVTQEVERRFAIDIVAPSADMEDIRASVKTSLLGKQDSSMWTPLVYYSGVLVDVVGHLTLWREVYATTEFVRG